MKILLKSVLGSLGAIIFLNGALICLVSNFNIGNILTLCLGAFIILTAVLFERFSHWLRIIFVAIISVAILFSCFLIIYGKTDNTTYKEDAVVVLGAAIHGKTPSRTLKHRLDVAVKYHQKNPDALIVVSGGQGLQEDISEAEAMKTYLIEKGVNPLVIIKEDKATSTYENFIYSKNILDTRLELDYTACFITNEYHILRASLCAKRAGITATHSHSDTTLSYLIPGVLRECLAVVKYIVLKK